MDNYPQINLHRVLKGVDFGTFYKVVKFRPEILDVFSVCDFDNEQTKQILNAFVDGLTLEQIKSCATPDYNSVQMLAIYNAYRSGLTIEQISIALNPDIHAVQMDRIIKGIQNGWEEKTIKLYSDPELGIDQIIEIYNAIQEICEQQGYQVVLDKSSTNNLIFASPKIDISDELLEKMGYSK